MEETTNRGPMAGTGQPGGINSGGSASGGTGGVGGAGTAGAGAAAGAAGATSGAAEDANRFDRARGYVGEKYDAASGRVRDGYNAVRERVDDVDFAAMTDQVRTYVRSNPGKALLVSVGMGFLVGLILRRDED